MNTDVQGLVARLKDLLKQATEERSHYYVATCCRDTITLIERQAAELERCRKDAERLANALGKYGRHLQGCYQQGVHDDRCPCGYTAALSTGGEQT